MVKSFHQNSCVNFVNSSLDNFNWNKISESLTEWDQFFLSKLWYIVHIYIISKKKLKREYTISSGTIKKMRLPRHLDTPWTFLDIDTQLYSLKIKLIQKLLNPTNSLWKDLKLYWLNVDLILNFNQSLALFRQKQILRYNRHKNLQKKTE